MTPMLRSTGRASMALLLGEVRWAAAGYLNRLASKTCEWWRAG